MTTFSRFFGTYLESSFDLVETPGNRRYFEAAHCVCPMCSGLVDMPHLQPKKPTKHDKRKAKVRMRQVVHALAHEEGLVLSSEQEIRVLGAPALREPLALVA